MAVDTEDLIKALIRTMKFGILLLEKLLKGEKLEGISK